ncbi:MAG: hemerythrin domain-containing protein [Flavobacteriales bacterium]|jgi:regulator of cell morphogenesis and NO signaling|nr:hemerythrin domain-containing protein [Flavobacteriales bacterium]
MIKSEGYVEMLNSWNLDDLVDHITNTHHAYLKANYPLILKLIDKLESTKQQKIISQVKSLFKEFTDDLAIHLVKEEEVLFPYFKKLAESKSAGSRIEPATFGNLERPIEMMEEEHDDSQDIMGKIKEITNNFTADKDADPSIHFLYFKLQEFDQDLEAHHELEDNLLFKKASELEKELKIS